MLVRTIDRAPLPPEGPPQHLVQLSVRHDIAELGHRQQPVIHELPFCLLALRREGHSFHHFTHPPFCFCSHHAPSCRLPAQPCPASPCQAQQRRASLSHPSQPYHRHPSDRKSTRLNSSH